MVASLYAFTGGSGSPGGSLPDATPFRDHATSVPQNAETTVVSHIVPSGYVFRLVGIVATGSADGEWIVYDDLDEVYRTRTSAADRGKELLHGNAIPFYAGHTCSLKVIHQEAATQNFYGTLLGYDR